MPPRRHALLPNADLVKVLGEWRYHTSAEGFFQVNPAQVVPLVEHVVASVVGEPEGNASGEDAADATPAAGDAGSGAVLDLYCGVGLFSLPLAGRGLTVAGVEWDAGAVDLAQRNAQAARRTKQIPSKGRLSFERRNLERPEVLPRLARKHGPLRAVVLDPPRRGLSADLIQALLKLAPPRIVYVSCDGGTFARDAARLAPRYRLDSLTAFDLFPQTHHLETVGVFTLVPE